IASPSLLLVTRALSFFSYYSSFFFLFNATAPTHIYTLSLHDALPICSAFRPRLVLAQLRSGRWWNVLAGDLAEQFGIGEPVGLRSEEHTSELQSHLNLVCRLLLEKKKKNKLIESSRKKRIKHIV